VPKFCVSRVRSRR